MIFASDGVHIDCWPPRRISLIIPELGQDLVSGGDPSAGNLFLHQRLLRWTLQILRDSRWKSAPSAWGHPPHLREPTCREPALHFRHRVRQQRLGSAVRLRRAALQRVWEFRHCVWQVRHCTTTPCPYYNKLTALRRHSSMINHSITVLILFSNFATVTTAFSELPRPTLNYYDHVCLESLQTSVTTYITFSSVMLSVLDYCATSNTRLSKMRYYIECCRDTNETVTVKGCGDQLLWNKKIHTNWRWWWTGLNSGGGACIHGEAHPVTESLAGLRDLGLSNHVSIFSHEGFNLSFGATRR